MTLQILSNEHNFMASQNFHIRLKTKDSAHAKSSFQSPILLPKP